jgi:hypothetical protein
VAAVAAIFSAIAAVLRAITAVLCAVATIFGGIGDVFKDVAYTRKGSRVADILCAIGAVFSTVPTILGAVAAILATVPTILGAISRPGKSGRGKAGSKKKRECGNLEHGGLPFKVGPRHNHAQGKIVFTRNLTKSYRRRLTHATENAGGSWILRVLQSRFGAMTVSNPEFPGANQVDYMRRGVPQGLLARR